MGFIRTVFSKFFCKHFNSKMRWGWLVCRFQIAFERIDLWASWI